jgi:hypothetical protein
MAFFDDQQLAELRIERMVVHLVGPKPENFVRLEAIAPGAFAPFFFSAAFGRSTQDCHTPFRTPRRPASGCAALGACQPQQAATPCEGQLGWGLPYLTTSTAYVYHGDETVYHPSP